MIAVCIATYNQEAYISHAIESVLAQQCDEPFRVYIGDDASMDNTQSICEQYAAKDKRVTYVRREQNIGLVANTIDLYRRSMTDGCKYIAMLDGDDYWMDEHKLQLQVDYLKTHPEVGLVHTGAYELKADQQTLMDDHQIPTGDLSQCYGLYGARQTNCTVVFRANLLREEELAALETQHFPILDYPLYGLFSQRTSFAFLPKPTAVWRNHTSVSQPNNRSAQRHYWQERLRMWRWLDEQHPGRFHYKALKAILWYIRQNMQA